MNKFLELVERVMASVYLRPLVLSLLIICIIGIGFEMLIQRQSLEWQSARLGLSSIVFKESFALAIGVIAVGASMLTYLRGDSRSSKSADYYAIEAKRAIRAVQVQLVELKAQSATNTSIISSTDLSELKTSIKDELLVALELGFIDQAATKYELKQIANTFTKTNERLREEISSLTRRGNLNLVIGVLTTLVAIGALIYMVPATTITFTNVTELLSHYIPRLTTVVFIEVFSFFFLRLYKSSLSEIKFYQNELTGLAAWQIALEMAHLSKDPANVVLVIERLVKMRETAPAMKLDPEGEFVNLKDTGDFVEKVGNLILKAKGKGA